MRLRDKKILFNQVSKHTKGDRGSTRGFSLVEVLAALVIISFMMLQVAQLYQLALNQQRNARYVSTLIRVAQQKFDQFRREGWTNSGTEIIEFSKATGSDPYYLGPGQPVIQIEWQATQLPGLQGLVEIRVTVTAGRMVSGSFQKLNSIKPNPVELVSLF